MIPTLFTRNITLPLVWRAPLVDGLGHAFGSGREERAACGAYPFDVRLAYEVTWRCSTCIALTGEAQLPERRRDRNGALVAGRRITDAFRLVPVDPHPLDSPAGAGEDVEAYRG